MSTVTHVAEDIFPGHPDRVADAIAERLVDEAVALDPAALVGVEVAVHRNRVFLTGRIGVGDPGDVRAALLPLAELVAEEVASAGYSGRWAYRTDVTHDLDLGSLVEHEREARGFSDDQNIVVGYAEGSEANDWLSPAPRAARLVREALVALRLEHPEVFGPDGKVLVRLAEQAGTYRWERVNVSLHHAPGAWDYEAMHRLVGPMLERVSADLEPTLPGLSASFDLELVHLNGAGEFSCGGTFGDNGLSGKKLVVDHYGPGVPIGGGALCGKDGHKVDRAGALAARQLAVHLVRETGSSSARVTLGWLPGAETPDAVTAVVDGEEWDEHRIRSTIVVPDLSLAGIFTRLELAGVSWVRELRRGYFGNGAAWER